MSGFVEGWVSKIEQALTKGQLGQSYKDELRQVIDQMLGQAKGWQPGPESKLVDGVLGRLRLMASLGETPEPFLPNKLSDPNNSFRVSLTREAIDMIVQRRSDP